MLICNAYERMCSDLQQQIRVTEYTEVEGGYGCAVEQTMTVCECSLQDTCRVYREGRCSLHRSAWTDGGDP